jgi:hypothetical protein
VIPEETAEEEGWLAEAVEVKEGGDEVNKAVTVSAGAFVIDTVSKGVCCCLLLLRPVVVMMHWRTVKTNARSPLC